MDIDDVIARLAPRHAPAEGGSSVRGARQP
jgi:hypothetical protein